MRVSRNLPGKAPKKHFSAQNESGVIVDPKTACFPIIKKDSDGRFHLVGTGFFIAASGLFVTAKHVVFDVIDSSGKQTDWIGIVQFIENSCVFRPILRCSCHVVHDVAVGVAAPMKLEKTGLPLIANVLPIWGGRIGKGETVFTYAYPDSVIRNDVKEMHFNPEFYVGKVEDHLENGRDSVFLPGPCIQTSMHVHGGASGGPVILSGKGVVGINSTGFSGEPLSFITPISGIRNLTVTDVRYQEGDMPTELVIDEIIRKKVITWKE